MKSYNSLYELRQSVAQRVSSEIVFFKNEEDIDVSLLKQNEILIEIKTNLIGDAENTLFLHVYNWMQKQGYLSYTVYIILPQDFERFSPVFISTLYLFNQGIGSQFVILGDKNNSRTYEFTHLAHSGLLSQNDLDFFTVASYSNDTNPLFWFSVSNTESVDKYVVSEKNLPLISIDSSNFEFYFGKSFKDLFCEPFVNYNLVDGKETYKILKKSINNLPVNQLKEPYAKLHFYKLLDNLQCLYKFYMLIHEKEVTLSLYEEKLKIFIDNILNRPVYQIFILLALLSNDFIRKRYLEIYKSITKNDKKSQNKTLVSTDNEDILSQYLNFLEEQNEIAKNIYDGIYELVKNTIEHASTKKGILTAKIIKQKNLIKLRNNSSEQGLWQDYFQSTQNIGFSDNEDRMYFDISIIDSGIVGIIETTGRNIDNKWRKISGETNNADREMLQRSLKDFQNSREKETEFLFNLYFQPQKPPILSRQEHCTEQSFGIKLFTEFITKNSGIFTVKTNKYCSVNETISFSLYNLNLFHYNDSDSPFGTAYNIVVPIREKMDKETILKEKNERKRSLSSTSRAVFEEMLSLDKFDLTQLPFDDIHGIFTEKNIETQYKIAKTEIDINYIAVISLFSHFRGDKSHLIRTFNTFLNNNDKCESLVIRNINEETITDVFGMLPETNVSRRDNKKVIVLITPENKIFVFAGKTIKDCTNINEFLSLYNRNLDYEFIKQGKVLKEEFEQLKSDLLDNPLFINGTYMLRIDLFEKDKKGITEFERKVEKRLEDSIDEGGYKWENAHLKISSKLHLKDFIYGKKLFQRSGYASDFAFLLSKEIFETIKTEVPSEGVKKFCYTLIGYGYYSELLVSQTREFIETRIKRYNANWFDKKLKVEYVIMKDEEEMNFSRYFQNLKTRENNFKNAKDRLIVIVPISSTLTTCLKIENSLTNQLKKKIQELEKPGVPINQEVENWLQKLKNIQEQNNKENKLFVKPFYTIVVVSDNVNFERLVENWNNITPVLRESKVWKGVKENRIILTENREKEYSVRENKLNIYIKSQWNLPKDCMLCFPKDDNPQKEQPLFKTDKVSVTPSLIFDKPCWYEYENQIYFYFGSGNDISIERINPNIYPILQHNMVDWAHYESDHKHKHYTYYTHYSPIIKENVKQIENWAREIKDKEILIENTLEKSTIGELTNILLIAPDKNENGEFLHLINRYTFDDRANIIKFDQSSDYFVNFKKFFDRDIDVDNLSIFFVDNLMAGSNTFLTLFEDVINALNSQPEHLQDDKKLKFKGIFCLINRMDYVCYTNVQNILDDYKRNIFAFMQLNIPVNLEPQIFCPLCKAEEMWSELIYNASCDCIKRYAIDKEKQYFKKIKKSDLTIQKFPYPRKNETSTLLKMMLIHFIYKAFADENKPEEKEAQRIVNALDKHNIGEEMLNFDDFVNTLKEYIKSNQNQTNYFEIKKDDKLNIKFKANLIKVLTHTHLRRHRGVKIAIFGWVLDELIKVSERLNNISTLKNEFKSENDIIEGFTYLRVLIKYGSILKTAYLLNENFLRAMCNLINEIAVFNGITDKYKEIIFAFDNFKIYCTTHIVRSLRKNEQRSTELEKNVNELLNENGKNIKPYTSFLELLILENTGIIRQTLNRLKEDFPYREEDFPSKEIEKCINSLFNTDDIRVRDFTDCYGKEEKTRLKDIWKLSNNLATNIKKDIEENDAGDIVKQMAEIVGYNNENYGGLLLLKYQDVKKDGNSELNKSKFPLNSEPDYIAVGWAGNDDSLMDCFEFDQTNEEWEKSLAVQLLKGKNYLNGDDYYWTNYTVYLDKDNKWKGQDNDSEEIICSETIKLNNMNQQNKIKRILFIRVAEQKDKDVEKEENKEKTTVGDAVFIFYDNKDQNQLQREDHFSIHKVRFAHVLRNELITYFDHRYNDDTFRAWVKQEEKNEYAFILNHGISTYEDAKDDNLEEYKKNPSYEPIFKMLLQYLVNKIELLSLVNSDKKKTKSISVAEIVKKFNESYINVFSFLHPEQISIYENPKYREYIEFDSLMVDSYYYNYSVNFPEGFLDELTFELLYNIRKHAITTNSKHFNSNNKLIIKLLTTIENGMLYLVLENNFYKPQPNGYENKAHGNTLINKILLKYMLGKLTHIPSEENKTYKVLIPIKAI